MPCYRQTGFTLIEMMITVAILGIIAAIAIPLYQGYVAEARVGTAVTEIRQAEVILDDLALQGDLAAVEPSGYAGTVIGVYRTSNGLTLGGLTTPPAGAQAWLDPWGQIYRYQRPATRVDAVGNVSNDSALPQGYDLFSQGPDTSDATDDVMRGCNGEFVGTAAGLPSC